MAPPVREAALELLFGVHQAEREQQLAHFDGLDAKAGLVLGFSGVLVALSGTASTGWLIAGLVASLVAAAAAVAAFWPRTYPTLLPSELRRYLTGEEAFTRLTLLDTTALMLDETSKVLESKSRRLKAALVALSLAAALNAAGSIAG